MCRLRTFLSDRRGNMALLFAFSLIPLCAAGGFAIDIGHASSARQHLQDAADGAAMMGVRRLPDEDDAYQQAAEYLDGNLDSDHAYQAQYASGEGRTQLTVTAQQTIRTTISGIIGIHEIPIRVTATARQTPGDSAPVCIHALAATASKAFEASGGSHIDALPCTVWVNSTSSASVTFSGGSYSQSARHCFQGGVTQGRFTPQPEACGARADPFEDMSPSSSATCTYSNFSRGGGTYTLQPGVYCGGLSLSGGPNVTLSPGVYIIRNGPLRMSGGGVMRGDGVVFLVEGASAVNLSGGGSYYLTAPRTGELAGFVFFQRPTSNVGGKAVISGSGDLYFEGILYFPSQKAEVSGGGSTQTRISPWTAYIARTFLYSGSSAIRVNYDPTRISVPIPNGLFSSATSAVLVR